MAPFHGTSALRAPLAGGWRALACGLGLSAAALAACSRPATPPAPVASVDAPAPGAPPPGQPAIVEARPPSPPDAPAPTAARVAAGGGLLHVSATDLDISVEAPPTAGPVPAPVKTAVAVLGDEERPLARDAPTLVDPRSSFRLEVAAHLADGRLALLDDQDAVIASSGTVAIGADWTRYELTPSEPLCPGSTYTLRLDGSATREAHDPEGRAYSPVMLVIQAAGDRPRPPTPRRHRVRRR